MENINYVSKGKTGDLVHCLLVIKKNYEKTGKKGNLYITDRSAFFGDTFQCGLKKTYEDLSPVLKIQKYINSFEILSDEIVLNEFVDLNSWRASGLVYKKCWTEILSGTYGIGTSISRWLDYETVDGLSDVVLIHRSLHRHSSIFPWESIIKNNKCKFITNLFSVQEYEQFPYKNDVELLLCNSFSDFVRNINSCKIFVGNLSAPLAICHALNKPHLCELWKHSDEANDEIHYSEEKKYFKDFFYIQNNGTRYVDGIEKFLLLKN